MKQIIDYVVEKIVPYIPTLHNRLIKLCFDFSDGDDDVCTRIDTIIQYLLDTIRQIEDNETMSKKEAIYLHMFLFKVVEQSIKNCVEKQSYNKAFFACNVTHLFTIQYKLTNIEKCAPWCLSDRDVRVEVMNDIYRIQKLIRAWDHTIATGAKLHFGVRGGLYTIATSTSAKRYW
jgi:hypothetical protein